MKIMMLGHSGVGKTTFMACMYAMLVRGVEDFSVVAVEKRVHRRLVDMAVAVMEGRYPEATLRQSKYDLALLYRNKAVFPFEWIDYRGNALNEAGSHREMQQLQQSIAEADGLIAFFDGVELARGGRAARSAVGRLMVVVQNAINQQERHLPIALVVTKADLIEAPGEVVKPILPLAEAIARSNNIHGGLVFTACGREVMANVDKPTLFVLHKGIHAMLQNMRAVFEAKKSQAALYQSKAGFFDWLDSRLSGVPTYDEMATKEREEANAIIENFNALVDPANALKDTLLDIEMF